MSESNRFQDNPSGAITDTQNQKQWLPKDSWQDMGKWSTWEEAKAYVHLMKQVYAGGFSDWRLPTAEEAKQLYDPNLTQKDWEDNEVHIDPLFVTRCASNIWTSDADEEGKIFRMDLQNGTSEYIDKNTSEHIAARLVRDIQS